MRLPDQLIGWPETQEQLRKLEALSSRLREFNAKKGAKGHKLEFYFTDHFIMDVSNLSEE